MGLRDFFSKKSGWSIGVYLGTPLKLLPSRRANNPILSGGDVTDIKSSDVADPFVVKRGDFWYMFFEAFNEETKKGEIGLATSKDGFEWKYQRIVLRERFHLSYPYVFLHENNYYMIPESREANAVRLYKAVEFPTKWVFVRNLLEGNFVDSSVVYHKNKWWMFAENSEKKNNTLRLFYSDELEGNWKEHPKSPIIKADSRIARAAGRVLLYDNKIIRYAQDCSRLYGEKVRAFKINRLTTKEYKEEGIEKPVLEPSGKGWNFRRMHHADAFKIKEGLWVAYVDGSAT